MTTTLLLICILLLVIMIILVWVSRPNTHAANKNLQDQLLLFSNQFRDELRMQREEADRNAQQARSELSSQLRDWRQDLRDQVALGREEMDRFQLSAIQQTEKMQQLTAEQLNRMADRAQLGQQDLRDAYLKFAGRIEETLNQRMHSFGQQQVEKFGQLEQRQQELIRSTEKKLEEMRQTVDEKLNSTLQERLGQSFALVGKQLESVQKGLGEMQTIAADVGGLKKVLSNVKLRGAVGEIQLAMLLEQILAPSQYEANVRTKLSSNDPVEFAIKLPGRSEDPNHVVYLPIDAKFPKDAYEHLISAYDNGHPEEIDAARKNLETTIRRMAKDIRDKYLDPPRTTDFAILFLPFESIYAEVIRRNALLDQLRQEYNVTIAGPTTLVALLNSLQMGFRTLALQQRSSEVWTVLSSVKTEFEKFGGLLEKAKNHIQTGLGQLDEVAGKRSRAIYRKLKDVESIPPTDTLADLENNDLPEWPQEEN